jgi:hypothetical protein
LKFAYRDVMRCGVQIQGSVASQNQNHWCASSGWIVDWEVASLFSVWLVRSYGITLRIFLSFCTNLQTSVTSSYIGAKVQKKATSGLVASLWSNFVHGWLPYLSIHAESLGLVTFIFCYPRDTHRPPWGLHGHLAGRAGGSGRELSRQRADGRNSAGRFLRPPARWAPETWRPRRRNSEFDEFRDSEIPRFAVFFRCNWLMLKDVIKCYKE